MLDIDYECNLHIIVSTTNCSHSSKLATHIQWCCQRKRGGGRGEGGGGKAVHF